MIRAGEELSGTTSFIEAYKPVLALPLLVGILALVWLFFRKTWRELDVEAQEHRGAILASGKSDLRPFLAIVLVAIVLTVQEYYGNRTWFDTALTPLLYRWDEGHPWLQFRAYAELYSFGWWSGARVLGYVLPLALWKIFYPEDSVRDLGLRTRGFFEHAWIYGLFLVLVLPAMIIVSRSPDFGTYYPFYKLASRSWFDFLAWEGMYFLQFFGLEMFFRGFFVGALRKSFGSGAIFAMALPYCMIHYGKPYLEACGAIIAGIALGSLAMKTKSIYQGFLVHITVAISMDWLSLRHRSATPVFFWPSGAATFAGGVIEDEPRREALARMIERSGIAFILVVLATIGFFFWRGRRRVHRPAPVDAVEDASSG